MTALLTALRRVRPTGGGATVSYGVVQTTIPTTTGTFDVTVPGLGTPKAAIITLAHGLTSGTMRDSAILSLGVTDGTNEWCHGLRAEHGEFNGQKSMSFGNDHCAHIISPSVAPTTYDVKISTDSFITDGIRLSLDTNVAASAYIINVFLIAGSGVSAHAGSQLLATQNNTVTVSPGFETNALLGVTMGTNLLNAFFTNTIIHSLGFGGWDGSTITQAASVYRSDEPSSTQGDIRSNGVATLPVGRYASLENITSTSFDLRSNGADLSGWRMGHLALSGVDAWAGVVDTPTSTGSHNMTGASFTPAAMMLRTGMFTATETQQTAGEASGFGYNFATADDEAGYALADEDGPSVSDTSTVPHTTVGACLDDAGTVTFAATVSSFISGGATLDFTTTQGSAKKWAVWFLG